MSDARVTWRQVPPGTYPAPEWQLAKWRAQGMPEEAIREDGTLRLEIALAAGWVLAGNWLSPPPTHVWDDDTLSWRAIT